MNPRLPCSVFTRRAHFTVALLISFFFLLSAESLRAQAKLQIINNFNKTTHDAANYFSNYYDDDQVWLYFLNTSGTVTYKNLKGVSQTVQDAQAIQFSNVKDGEFTLAKGGNSTKVFAGLGSSNPFSGTNGPGIFDTNVPYALAEWTIKGNVWDNVDLTYEDSISFPTILTVKDAGSVQKDQAAFPSGTQASDVIAALKAAMPNAPVGPNNDNYPSPGDVGWGPLVPTISGKTSANRWIGSSKFWISGPDSKNLRSMYIYAPSLNSYLKFLKDNETSQFANGISGWFIDYSGNTGYSGYLSVDGTDNAYSLRIHDIRIGTSPNAPNWKADPNAGTAANGEITVLANNENIAFDSKTTVTGPWTDAVIYSGAAMIGDFGDGPVVTGTDDFAINGPQIDIVPTMLASISASMATGLLGSDMYTNKIKDASPGATMYWFNTMTRSDSIIKLFDKAWAGQTFYDPFWKTMANLTGMQGYLSPFNDRWSNFSPDFSLGANYTIVWELGITGSASVYSISGSVSGEVKNGVTITLSGDSADTTTTDANGAYAFQNLANGKYVITPSLLTYSFKPATSSVTISGSNQSGQNFVATAVNPGTYSINGTITGDVIEDVTITLSGDASQTTTTDHNGNYTFVNLSDGDYTVTPSLSGYDFEPASRNVAIAGADQAVPGFTSTGGEVAVGLKFVIEAADVKGLPAPKKFMAKPKVYVKYDTASKTGLKASAVVLTKIDKTTGATSVDCEWTKKIPLFDSKAFKAAEAQGTSASIWANNAANQKALEMDLCIESSELWEESLRTIALAVPVITDISSGGKDAKGNDLLVITGHWFGTKAPKVWREYTDSDNAIQHQSMKLVKPTVSDGTGGYMDNKGMPAYMNAETGASKVIVIIPSKAPQGKLNGAIVLDNGAGMATGTAPGGD